MSKQGAVLFNLKVVVCIFLLLPSLAFSMIRDDQTWLNVTAMGNLSYKDNTPTYFKYWLEQQERFGEDVSRLSQGLWRVALGYALTPNTSVWFGYAWIYSSLPLVSPSAEENRIWQQLLWVKSLPQFTFTNRTRFEQRFFQNRAKVGHRWRELLKLSIPIKPESKVSLVGSNEAFWNNNNYLGTKGHGFDQNRLFIGLGYKFNSWMTTEIGYMNQYVKRVDQDNFMANIFSVTLFLYL